MAHEGPGDEDPGDSAVRAGSAAADAPSLLRQAVMPPNLLSILRLAGVPVFLWLLLGPHADGWALAILVFSGLTDWLDGKLARWLNQMSRLGQLLDPAADRLYIVATLVAFLLRDIVPWWAVGVLLLREGVAGICVLVLRYNRFAPPEVTYVGKGATFVLMYAFPLLLLVQGDSTAATIAAPLAYAFTIWGGVLYVWSGVLYAAQTLLAVTRDRRSRRRRAAG
ncbi:CDP-diacylglycerol--glycerol-3-phosphate 3-phosphatidyltransferase [Prauserella alba]|uniref:CDP-alcohol phosphatidyltransferase family protein n=2 Tax=Prauserella alba TaxID=176898 RepID=A0ABN1V4M1_9PSEU|nr:CDP-diacylglycerol--glycerol-3-phosphate 3-phosphatidyltransferase [Prauserella alba]